MWLATWVRLRILPVWRRMYSPRRPLRPYDSSSSSSQIVRRPMLGKRAMPASARRISRERLAAQKPGRARTGIEDLVELGIPQVSASLVLLAPLCALRRVLLSRARRDRRPSALLRRSGGSRRRGDGRLASAEGRAGLERRGRGCAGRAGGSFEGVGGEMDLRGFVCNCGQAEWVGTTRGA